MKKNVGRLDRISRLVGALALAVCAVVAPSPLAARVLVLGGLSGYMLFSAVAGTCFGYALLGKGTCALEPK